MIKHGVKLDSSGCTLCYFQARSHTVADLGLLAGGSQSIVVICHSTYEPGGTTRVVLLTEGLILAGC